MDAATYSPAVQSLPPGHDLLHSYSKPFVDLPRRASSFFENINLHWFTRSSATSPNVHRGPGDTLANDSSPRMSNNSREEVVQALVRRPEQWSWTLARSSQVTTISHNSRSRQI